MKTFQLINQLLTAMAYVIRQRHLPELADTIKQASVLVQSLRGTPQDIVDEKLAKLVKAFEAKLAMNGEVTAQDLVMETAKPLVEEMDFTPLPDEVEVELVEVEEDFLADLDDELGNA